MLDCSSLKLFGYFIILDRRKSSVYWIRLESQWLVKTINSPLLRTFQVNPRTLKLQNWSIARVRFQLWWTWDSEIIEGYCS